MNNETKNILASKTFWAAFAVLLMAGLKAIGHVPAGLDDSTLADSLYSGVIAVLGLLAIGGRIVASKTITILPAQQPPTTP